MKNREKESSKYTVEYVFISFFSVSRYRGYIGGIIGLSISPGDYFFFAGEIKTSVLCIILSCVDNLSVFLYCSQQIS